MFSRTAFIVLIVISFLFCYQNSYAITIGPSRLEVRLPAGEVASADYYAQNETDSPIHVTVEPENWFQDVYDFKGMEAKDWIKTDVKEFDLKPKEIKKVVVTIRVPKNATGELAAQIFFSSAVANTDNESGGSISSRLGAVLYVAIKNTEKVAAEIKNISVSNLDSDGKKYAKFNIGVKNNGNIHLRPSSGEIVISDEKKQDVARFDFNTDQSILPGQQSDYIAIWDNPEIKEGKYKISVNMKYGKMYVREKTAVIKKTLLVGKNGEMNIK
jgi:hypothetical protein